MKISKRLGYENILSFLLTGGKQMDEKVLKQIIARTATTQQKKQNRNTLISSLTKVGLILYLFKVVWDVK